MITDIPEITEVDESMRLIRSFRDAMRETPLDPEAKAMVFVLCWMLEVYEDSGLDVDRLAKYVVGVQRGDLLDTIGAIAIMLKAKGNRI